MRWLSKLAFICNLMFLLSLVLQRFELELPQWLTGTILVLGWFPVAPFLNIAFVIALMYFVLSGRKASIPVVISILNILIIALQFYVFFIKPGK